MKRKLDATLSDYDIRVADLQNDISELRSTLEEQQRAIKNSEKENSAVIAELNEHNQKLSAQLKESSKNEEKLIIQLQSLKDQFSLRKVVLSDHVTHLENLREEVC